MRVPWKLVGLAGVASVAATGAVVARRRRDQRQYDPDELRAKLHERLAGAEGAGSAADDDDDGGAAGAPPASPTPAS